MTTTTTRIDNHTLGGGITDRIEMANSINNTIKNLRQRREGFSAISWDHDLVQVKMHALNIHLEDVRSDIDRFNRLHDWLQGIESDPDRGYTKASHPPIAYSHGHIGFFTDMCDRQPTAKEVKKLEPWQDQLWDLFLGDDPIPQELIDAFDK